MAQRILRWVVLAVLLWWLFQAMVLFNGVHDANHGRTYSGLPARTYLSKRPIQLLFSNSAARAAQSIRVAIANSVVRQVNNYVNLPGLPRSR
jgi:hypothetical protein